MITAKFDLLPIKRKLQKLSLEFGKPVKELVKHQARLFVSNNGKVPGVVQITPPFSKKVRGNKAKKQGIQAIKTDIGGGKRSGKQKSGGRAGILTYLNDGLIDSALETGQYSTGNVRLFIKADGTVYGTEKALFAPDANNSRIHQHKKQFWKNGTMSAAGGATRNIGRWKFIDKLVVRKRAFDRYLAFLSKRVGLLASVMNAAAEKLKAKGVPAWVLRHGNTFGKCSINENKDWIYITITASAPYAAGETARRFRYVLQYRETALKSAWPYVKKYALKQANLNP